MKNTALLVTSLLLFFLLAVQPVQAQFGGGNGGPGGGNGGMGGGMGSGTGSYTGRSGQGSGQPRPSIGHVFGKVIDAKTKKPVEFASVALFKAKNDSLIT